MTDTNLVMDIPVVLDEALQKSLISGEQIIISIPGAMGEALAASDRRVFVLRERPVLSGVDVFAHALDSIKDVTVEQMATGGVIKVSPTNWMPDDQRSVYFPADSKPIFDAAASAVRQLMGSGAAVAAAPAPQPAAPVARMTGSACPSCGAEAGERFAFCTSCGTQVREVCRLCGGAMPTGAKFCPFCGSEHKTAGTKCQGCGSRINETVMSYCPQCGTAVSTKCVSCGAAIIEGWPRCRYCGREIGSMDGLTARGIRAAVAAQSEATASPAPAVQAPSEEPAPSPGAAANARGAELFDKEDYEAAIEDFREAVMLEPNNASFHCNLAVAYDELDMDEDAQREYERTLELNPNDITAMLYLGYMLNENGESERAAQLWHRLAASAPGSPEAEEAEQAIRAQEEL